MADVLRPRRIWLTALRCAALGLAVLLAWRVLAAANAAHVSRLLASVGLGGVLVLFPQLFALGCEAWGWRRAFRAGGMTTSWRALLRVRVATEALAQSLPVGVAFAESAKPLLLAKHCGLSVDQSVAGIAVRKVLLIVSQALYIAGMVWLGFAGLEAASPALIPLPHLGFWMWGAALVLGAGGTASVLLLRRSSLALGAFRLLERVPSARVRAWLDGKQRLFFATDGAVSALFRVPPRRLAGALFGFVGAWCCEAFETWLILSVLGMHVSFATAGSLEVVLSLVRNVVFVVPAGLGVQDLGYATCFAALGVPEAASVGAAFVLLKRGKELFWIAVGYALLGLDLGLRGGRAPASKRPVSLFGHAQV